MSQPKDQARAAGGDYERPGQRFRCGRGAAWGKPCANGPTPDGKCGGAIECQPALRNGKFECRRPASQGGPCAEGPKADGSCSRTHPPCIPRVTLRVRRGRMAWQVCGLLVLLLAAGFHFGRGTYSRPLAVEPGPLSAKHGSFAATKGCATCHPAHNAGFRGLLKAAFHPADMNAQCGNCHAFGGPVDRPHNETTAAHAAASATVCRQCHTEHRGANGNITPLTDEQCNTCHKVKFARFDHGHPPFPTNFPHVARSGIKFNHARHLLEYFKQPEYAARAAQSCTECHAASPTEARIRTPGFDVACARCHAEQIPQNELVLLRLPEPVADPTKIPTEDATSFMAWFFQRASTTNYGAALQQFLAAAAKEGAAPLARTLEANWRAAFQAAAVTNVEPATNSTRFSSAAPLRPGVPRAAPQDLVAGLSPELLARPAQLWVKGEKFEPPALPAKSGWYWLEDLYPELRYKPAAHADPVARAWLEFALAAAARETNATDLKRAAEFRDEVTHLRASVGRCVKCHAISAPDALSPERQVEWRYAGNQLPPHTKFSHGAHLGLRNCVDCHALNPQADFEAQYKEFTTTAGVSNFKSIALENCTSCHAKHKVRNDCRLCHQYHREPSLKEFAVSKQQPR